MSLGTGQEAAVGAGPQAASCTAGAAIAAGVPRSAGAPPSAGGPVATRFLVNVRRAVFGVAALAVLSAVLAAPSRLGAQTVYIAFGDSITSGVGDDPHRAQAGYPPRLQSLLEQAGKAATVINDGLPGEDTAAGLARLPSVLNQGGNVLLLMEGTNDINEKVSTESIIFNLGHMANRAEQRGLKAIHVTIIPRLTNANTDPNNIFTAGLAAALREHAWLNQRSLVDLFEEFFHLAPGGFESYYGGGSDRLHPNSVGYDLMARTFADVLTNVDRIPPVTGDISPGDNEPRVPATTPISVVLYDFGAGIDLTATSLRVNGQAVTATLTGDKTKVTLAYQPPQPLTGQIVVGVHSRDLASTPNVLDRDVATFIIAGSTFVPGDINMDGRVDGADLLLLALSFGARRGDPRYNAAADLNNDSVVDGLDLSILAANFGKASQ
jgi:acyl-CoA thioesterase-1